MKIAFLVFLLILFESTINFQEVSICKQIILNRKKQGGINHPDFEASIQRLKLTIHDSCIVELEPKYYWAQNMTFIMVRFDFQVSSRTSCSEVLYSEKNITYEGFQLTQYCLQSDQVIKYSVKIKTYKNLNYHFSNWKKTELNGLIFECLKSPTPYFWPKLYSQASPPQINPRIWWQLQQKQDKSVQDYMGLLEIDQSQIQISTYVKKMKKKSQKNIKLQNSDIQFYCNEGSPYFLGSWF